RIESHDHVTALLRDAFMAAHPHAKRAEVRLAIRLSVEAMYAAHELLFDDPSLDARAVGRMMADMVASQFARLKRRPRASGITAAHAALPPRPGHALPAELLDPLVRRDDALGDRRPRRRAAAPAARGAAPGRHARGDLAHARAHRPRRRHRHAGARAGA